MGTYLFIVFTLYGVLRFCLANDKRILLNDNDVYQQIQELQALKVELASLQTKVDAQNTEIGNLNNMIAVQNQSISFLEQKVFTQNQTATSQIAYLEQKILTQNKTSANQAHTISSFEQKVISQNQDVASLQLSMKQLLSQGSGAVYTRWGRLGCPTNGTELVYTGFAAGDWYGYSGSASNPVCLPHDPDHLTGVKASNGVMAHIFGGEFKDNVYGTNINNKDVPCAVCFAKTASSILMIPGKNTCYADWKLEYSGILSSGYYNHAGASEYVCVDRHSETLEGGYENKNGKLFYPVHTECGTLRCPPYRNEEILSCAVCSK